MTADAFKSEVETVSNFGVHAACSVYSDFAINLIGRENDICPDCRSCFEHLVGAWLNLSDDCGHLLVASIAVADRIAAHGEFFPE